MTTNRTLIILLVSPDDADPDRLAGVLDMWDGASEPLDKQITFASSVDEAIRLLETCAVDIVLHRHNVADASEPLRRLLQHAHGVPVVVSMDEPDPSFGLAMLRAGAADYIVRAEATPRLVARTLIHALERAQGERRTRAAQDRILRDLETIPLAVITFDRNWRMVYMNRAMERHMERQRDSLLGHVVWEAFPELIGTDLERQYRRAMSEGVDVQFQYRFDSGVIAEVFAHPTDDGLSAYLTDVTERVQAERLLENTHDRYRALFENSLDGIIESQPDGTITAANAAAGEILGVDAASLIGKGRIDVMDIEDPGLPAAIAARESAGRFHGELMMRRADGSIFPAELSSAVFRSPDGSLRTTTTIRDITDRHRAEQALRESESRFRGVFEQAAFGLVLLDPEGQVLEMNERLVSLLGYTTEELKRLGWRAVTHADDLEPEIAEAERLRKGAIDRFILEKRYLRRDGSTLWALLNTSRLRAADGSTAYYLAAIEDISAMKYAEAALRESEERFRQLAENVRDVFWVKRAGSDRPEYVSPAFREIWGREPADLVSGEIDLIDTIHSDDRRAALAAFTGEFTSTWSIEYRIFRPDGEQRWIRDRGFAILDSEDEIHTRMAGVAQDITDMKRAEEELRRSEAHFRSLIDHASEIVSIAEADGRFRYLNPAVERLLGYQPAELVGRSLLEMMHPDDRPEAIRAMSELASEAGTIARLEVRVRHRDGGWRDVEGVGRNLLHHPAIYGIVTHIRDVTERKSAEEALRKSEEALRQAQKMEAVGRLAGGIAHDFNNLLTAIGGHAELILERLPEGRLRADVEEIRRGADRAASLTRQLLAFSRRQVLQPKLLDAREVLASMEQMLRRLLGEDLTLEIALPDQLGPILADASQIEQVILNLAVNGRDAMPDGGHLRIALEDVVVHPGEEHLHHGSAAGAYVSLRVRDSGDGIPPEILDQIYEPFFTTKDTGKGTGLGLSTVYGIVRQTGGYIGVDSNHGVGTEFSIYLPVADGEPESVPERAIARRWTGRETILLVEDESSVRALASRVLRRNGYTVLEAGNGMEGLELAQRLGEEIDLVVSDVVMPQMSGPEMATRLQQAWPGLRVLFISGYSAESQIRQGVLRETDLFLEKPFAPEGLARAVREALDDSPAAD